MHNDAFAFDEASVFDGTLVSDNVFGR